MTTTQEKIAVMQAHVDGKKIEFRLRHTDNNWEPVVPEYKAWNWSIYEFRIKPKLIYGVANIYSNHNVHSLHPNIEQANFCQAKNRFKFAYMIEVDKETYEKFVEENG